MNWTAVSRLLHRRLDLVEETGETFYAGIEQVPAGTAFELRADGALKEWQFWSLDELPEITVTDPPAQFRELFQDAVRLRMRSDVPVGVSLSGGIDSTSIISVMATHRTAAGTVVPAGRARVIVAPAASAPAVGGGPATAADGVRDAV